MTADQIADVLRLHGMWLRAEDGGRRAVLQGADLQGADLRDADLQGADLRDADLQGADLRDADLRGADLQGADLRDADLRGADLQGADLQDAVGVVRLPVGDPRGYDPIAVWHTDCWMIVAGCRWLLVSDARTHWGEAYQGIRHIGDRYLYALDWLETSAEAAEARKRAEEVGR